MKKLLLLISSLIITSGNAQINPDHDFDGVWTTNTNYPAQEPHGWISTNVLTNSFASSSNPVSITKSSTTSCSGGFSMRAETKKFNLGFLTGFLPDTCGFAFTGAVVVNISGGKLIDGFPYNQRPPTITYCYKAAPAVGDTAGVGVLLWTYNGTSRTYIGGAVNKYTTSNSSMANGVLNIAYSSTVTPDSMCIYVGSSYKFPTAGTSIRKGAKIGSVIYVDSIRYLANTVGMNEIKREEIEIAVYPNPAKSSLFISTESTAAKELHIIDLTGKIIEKHYFTNGKIKLDVSTYTKGLYFYSILGETQQNLKTGKFTVTQ